jgi:hypothetical protein
MTSLRLSLKILTALGLVLAALHIHMPATFAADPASILLVVDDAAAPNFDRYLGEILRAEGLNSFKVLDISTVTGTDLTQHDMTILAQMMLNSSQEMMFTDYVNGGDRLLAIRPDPDIAGLFGLTTSSGTLTDGYLKFDADTLLNGFAPGWALTTSTLQIHGAADQYGTDANAVVYAQLYSDASTATSYPAVVGHTNGRAVAFTYDLATNIVYTRQGNPANADVDVDGDTFFRTVDLFQGSGSPWVDRDRIPIPQADEQQRLFARLIRYLVVGTKPLPQLWYFPGAAKTMLVLTGDAHANPFEWYQSEINSVNTKGGKITIYLPGGSLSNVDVQMWRGQGHEFGIHPYHYNDNPPPVINNLNEGYTSNNDWYTNQFSTSPSPTVRHHRVIWQGWTDAAELAISYGMKLDANFYHWGTWLQKPDTTWAHGYITGSGQPMKFIKANGTVLSYYQQLTQLVDEQLFDVDGGGCTCENLNETQGMIVSQQLIDSSLAGDYAALMTQFHVDYFSGVRGWAEGIMNYANQRGVPMWNADQWLNFIETRHDANYQNIVWNAGTSTLTFNMTAAAAPNVNLTTMLPLYEGRDVKTITVDGVAQSFSTQLIKGVSYDFVTVPAGNHSFNVAYYPAATPASLFPSTAAQPQTLRPLFDWTNVGQAQQFQGYTLQVALDRNFAVLLVNQNASSSAHVLTTDLPRGTTLYWRARANTPNGSGNWSAVRSFDTPNPPGLPIPLTPAGGMTILGYTPTLDWTDSIPPAVRYDVQIATDNGFVNVLGRGQGGPTGVSQYTVEVPLDPNTPSYPYYYWRVRAYNGDSPFGVFIFSEWSGVASFKTPP